MRFVSKRWIEALALAGSIVILFNYGLSAAHAWDEHTGSSNRLSIKTHTNASNAETASSVVFADETSSVVSKLQTSGSSRLKSKSSAQDSDAERSASEENKSPEMDQSLAHGEQVELKPIANPEDAGPVPLEAASFKGVTPGATTLEEVEKAWGPPKEIFKQNNLMTELYSVKPFDRVEVCSQQNKVISIVIRFNKPFPAEKIAQQLDMTAIRPVLVSNEMGEILGQAYPERGVLLAFTPSEESGKLSMKVAHIILEPLDAEPFILRAQTYLDRRYDLSLRDLQQALNLQPENARAQWLISRVLMAMEKYTKAEAASAEAVRLEPDNPKYRLTRAQILGKMGRYKEAILQAKKAVETSKNRAHVQAQALCLLGDLTASKASPDFHKAIDFHTQAVRIADSLANDPHPAIRQAAKEVLVDAHLGAVHDIAWGDWKDKEEAVNKWLERADAFANDFIRNEGGSKEKHLQVCTTAISACVGSHGKINAEPWIRDCLKSGKKLIASANGPVHKAQYQWELGLALYDIVQIYQMRSEHDKAKQYAQLAAEYLEEGYNHKRNLTAAYTLGRLYFRLGAIEAIRGQHHDQAVEWFDKAVPLLKQPLPAEAANDVGRKGETFVSMGLSYWETKQRKKAVKLTKYGISLAEKAVKQGTLDKSALVIPYNNLAAMHRQLGESHDADRYQKMAARIKDREVK